jgi:hypothetical protein
MLRILMAMLAVVALTVSAAAYTTQWDGDQTGQLDINLTLNCYIQILWQDSVITFSDSYTFPNGDYWCNTLEGAQYTALPGPDSKPATDPWAGNGAPYYFESGDGADIYVKSNNALSMRVTPAGDLQASGEDDCPDCTIPTWFTCALSGPFVVQGLDIGLGTIPGDGNGVYLADGGSYEFSYTDGTYGVWPNQHAFSCADTGTWHLGPLCPYVEGNIKFLARILRSGMADAGGDYTTHLDVAFASPDF